MLDHRGVSAKVFSIGFITVVLCAIPVFAGSILRAKCPCGFDSGNFNAGGGMANFKTFCGAPAYCPENKKFLILNYLDDAAIVHACTSPVVFYNDPCLQEKRVPTKDEPKTVFSWYTDKKGTFDLPDVHYLCPACGKMTLTFTHIGMWD